ncbi:tRNA (adenosine(37)-N6)-threonylcarbamoyltransferase complex dimerization subunit type 1 TsaB [Alcaligenaceae bacterium CGII-47]|nr:tRNA (adenosine(37)-N6)-threonylcarbamoyltransferase complex dimerization subunit type 1 TsaB [Alcaligenaceae bacterium CGII-47]
MNELQILAFETSHNVCGVALLSRVGNRVRLRTAHHEERGQHAERLLPMAEALLEDAGLDRAALTAVAFGQGPGGFTGLRVACGVAQGMALALSIPVVPIGSLMAVAAQHAGDAPDGWHVVLQDARMREVYAAVYRYAAQGGWQTVQAPRLLALADIPHWLAQGVALWECGAALQVHGDALLVFEGLAAQLTDRAYVLSPGQDINQARAQVAMIARLALSAWDAGCTVSPELAAPIYVRDKVAYTTEERAQGMGGNPQAPVLADSLHIMNKSDLDEVAAIESLVQAFPWQRNHFADGLIAGYQGWVVRQQDRIVGFAMVMDTPDMAHLLVIGVRPDAQRQGVGARLLAQCQVHAQAQGLNALTLEVRPSNTQAISFYRQHGFDHVGTRKAYYPLGRDTREDAWIMTKTWVGSV